LLFSLALPTTLALPQCDFVAGYLDDVTLGGSVESLAYEVISFRRESSTFFLELNIVKCKIIGLEESARQTWSTTHLDFHEPLPQDAVLLGSPLFDPGINISLHSHSLSLERICKRLLLLSSHEAFFY